MSINVSVDGREAGVGSKQTVKTYNNDTVIMKVASNVPNGDFHKTAIIENLIIDGGNNGAIRPGTIGILLKDVYNCIIRNVTIKNCEIGIKIENTNNYCSESNCIEHIRMSNVKTGILFTAISGNSGDFGFTTIKDVGIKLNNVDKGNINTDTLERVGIQIGTANGPVVKPYSSFIKATIWLSNYGNSCGLKVYGELKYSLVMLAVETPEHEDGAKVGMDILTNPSAVSNNQSFMLSYGDNISPVIKAISPLIGHDIVTEHI
ncbi:MAG: hypothetical protein FWD52_01995 [Candidatus Bathyarchaeota archaeon]|nr:hypothetical protein [Candidatus Termiticorpusculum sp.]